MPDGTPYKAGTLDVELLGASDGAIDHITRTAKALRSLSTVLKKMEDINFSFSAQKIEALFRGVGKATNSINTQNITALASASKSLSAISRIGNLQNVDYAKIASGFNQLSVAITPFLNKIKTAEASLVSLHGVMRGFGKIKGVTEKTSSRGGIFSFLNISKWLGMYYVGRRFGRVVQDIAQSGADYTETLNLWETSMRNNLTLATEFISKMNKAYGISEKTLMNAQATFNNMLGSLGQIDEATAYVFSEGITQMAVDYASLYNTTFEKAFEKFQSALAGQVRPIRSVSGFDITENTIYQLYQQLGGTKSVRNLSRTEKQLLSILAIYNQMQRSGAIGDLDKTMESYANQSRLMAESWLRAKAYAGSLLTNLIQQSGWMTRLNANLIFLGDVLKAVAESTNAIQHFNNDPFAGFEASAEDANSAIDELTGKLLDFDKFRSLSGSDDDVAVDQALLNALTGIDGILENATSSAHDLAKELKIASGLFNEDGTFNKEKWDDLLDSIEAFGHAILAIIASKALIGIANGIKAVAISGKGLSNILLTGVIFALLQAIDAFRDGDIWAGILATTIGVALAGAFIYLHRQAILKAWQGLGQFLTKMVLVNTFARGSLLKGILGLSMAFVGLGSAVIGAFAIMQSWGDMNSWQKIISIIGVATTAILGLAMAFGAFHSAWSLGLASAGIVAGIAMIVGSISSVKGKASSPVKYAADGASDIDSGTLFVAGEMGKTEAVYTGSNGKTNVANIQQMQSAFNGALNNWWSSAKHDIPQFREVSKTGIYEVAKGEMKRRGEW